MLGFSHRGLAREIHVRSGAKEYRKVVFALPKEVFSLPQDARPEWVVFTPKEYRSVPEENLSPISFTYSGDLLKRQMERIVRWLPVIDVVLEENDFPYVDRLLLLGMLSQETQGDNDAKCNDFDTRRGNCAIGLMGITPGRCGLTAAQLKNPSLNIRCGAAIINQVYGQSLEHGFRPGREAMRAALGAYNCSWPSLLENRCYSFGGYTYSDKINNYWTPLIENHLGETK